MMRRTQRALALLLALAAATGGPLVVHAAPLGPDERGLIRGNSAFAVDLYGRLKEKEGNLFFSPYSISTALAMTYAGARGDTEAQMAKVLHFGLGQDKLHGAFQQVAGQLKPRGKKPGYQLSVANALWGQEGYKFLDPFLHIGQTHYDGGLRPVDFAASETARKRINTWVEKETRGKIKDLIPSGVIDSLTRLVLTNAIYFKGDWLSQFDKAKTKDKAFTLQDGKTVQTPTMHQTGKFGYMETPLFQAVELPYVGRDLSMTILLPRAKDGLPAFEKTLTADKLAQWLRGTRRPRKVILSLPKFTITCNVPLSAVLQAMGMTDAFSRKANFAGINGKSNDLYIKAVLHKAFVDVNEEGTEAAAATAVVVATRSARRPLPPVVFKADHPFLFVIRHRLSGSILFMGRVANPKESE